MTSPMTALLVRKARRKHALEIPKMEFYRDYFDVEQFTVEAEDTVTVVHLNRKVLAYRDGNTYYKIDDETAQVI